MSVREDIDAIIASDLEKHEKEKAVITLIDQLSKQGPGAEAAEAVSLLASNARSRAVLRDIGQQVLQAIKDVAAEQDILETLVRDCSPFLQQLGELDIIARLRLADLYEAAEEFEKSPLILQDLGGATDRQELSKKQRFHILVRIVRCYLELEQPENAVSYLSKAQYLRPSVIGIDTNDDIHFRLSQARIADSEKRFLDAAQKYHSVSLESAVEDSDCMACLAQATLSAIMAPAGPSRKEVLRRIYNDERSESLPQRTLLDKAYHDQVFSASDIQTLAEYLAPHQKAQLPDGTTVLTRAIFDHNILSISKVYADVSISTLASLLELDQLRTEAYAAKMISQDRLAARIDQEAGVISFRQAVDLRDAASPFAVSDVTPLVIGSQDERVLQLCHAVDNVISDLQDKYPEVVSRILTVL
jgi:COP9 signalosome complex subunit 4